MAEKLVKGKCIAIVCAGHDERDSILAAFKDRSQMSPGVLRHTDGHPFVSVELDSGITAVIYEAVGHSPAVLVTNICRHHEPRWLVMVSRAVGRKGVVNVGDVVLATATFHVDLSALKTSDNFVMDLKPHVLAAENEVLLQELAQTLPLEPIETDEHKADQLLLMLRDAPDHMLPVKELVDFFSGSDKRFAAVRAIVTTANTATYEFGIFKLTDAGVAACATLSAVAPAPKVVLAPVASTSFARREDDVWGKLSLLYPNVAAMDNNGHDTYEAVQNTHLPTVPLLVASVSSLTGDTHNTAAIKATATWACKLINALVVYVACCSN